MFILTSGWNIRGQSFHKALEPCGLGLKFLRDRPNLLVPGFERGIRGTGQSRALPIPVKHQTFTIFFQ